MDLVHARARRRFQRGLNRKATALIKKLRKAKKEATPGEKPSTVKTHLRNMIVVPEMIGSVVGIYNGKTFNQVEVKVRCGDLHLSSCGSHFYIISLKWSVTTWVNSPSLISRLNTVVPVSVPLPLLDSFRSSKFVRIVQNGQIGLSSMDVFNGSSSLLSVNHLELYR